MNEKNVTIQDLYHVLRSACFDNAVNTVRYLLDLGLNVDGLDENGNLLTYEDGSPLLAAVDGYSPHVVELLLKRGANPNLESKRGLVPLFLACELEYEEIARQLLAHGADIDGEVPYDDLSPIQQAVIYESSQAVELLCKLGANMELMCDYDFDPGLKTPLMLAVTYYAGNFEDTGREILEILLERGANPNATNADGKTALMFAVENGFDKAVELLLGYGANPWLKDNSGETALDKTQDKRVRLLLYYCHLYSRGCV